MGLGRIPKSVSAAISLARRRPAGGLAVASSHSVLEPAAPRA